MKITIILPCLCKHIHTGAILLKVCIIFLFLFEPTSALPAKNLIKSRTTSEMTYIYSINEKEATVIQKKGVYKVDSCFFHTLIDVYPTDSVYSKKLAPGHYLKTFANANSENITYCHVPSTEVVVMNNTTDLCIRVYNMNGTIVSNAIVRRGWFQLHYDTKTQCYIQPKSNSKGMLSVKIDNLTSYYDLERSYNNPAFKRIAGKTLRSVPIRYVWQPVSYLVSLPFDAVISLIKNRPYGSIKQTKWLFRKRNPSQNYFHPGYMVTNKPKYLPGDTLKMKAFLVNKDGKPSNEELLLKLNVDRKNIVIKKLKPYYPGAYECSFVLHDSLKIKLDNNYQLFLANKDADTYLTCSFRYEAYELNNVSLSLRTESNFQYAGKPFKLYARAIDNNKLNIPDARLEIICLSAKTLQYFKSSCFVPDTLWKHTVRMPASGETVISVPDSVFPEANLNYKIKARVLTSDNKTSSAQKDISFFYLQHQYDFFLSSDSLAIRLLINGIEKPAKTVLYATDCFGNDSCLGSIHTPCKIALNPFFSSYYVINEDKKDKFEVSRASSGLQCFTRRTIDSVFIHIDNPRLINFVYNIYRYNTEIKRGSGTTLNFKAAANTRKNYYIALNYLWGGVVKNETYKLSINKNQLNIDLKQPSLVYPGQKVPVAITVTDQKGKPVSGVDLTAYAITGKFNYNPPPLHSFYRAAKEKEQINKFRIDPLDIEKTSKTLPYQNWKAKAGLDSIPYYQFLYPGTKIYSYSYPTRDKITQVAPYVVSASGALQTIHVIYINNVPVYFNWSNNYRPYSFAVGTENQKIELRLLNKSIVLNNQKFIPGTKTILSIPENYSDENVISEKKPNTFTSTEKFYLNRFIFPYVNNFNNEFSYLQDDNSIQLLSSPNNYNNFAGPVSGKLSAGILNQYSISFQHEAGYTYEIAPALVKMKEIQHSTLPTNKLLYNGYFSKNLGDSVLTKNQLFRRIANYNLLASEDRYRHESYLNTDFGPCTLHIDLINDMKSLQPLCILLIPYDKTKTIQFFGGLNRKLYQISPGYYKLAFLYRENNYFVSDYVDVKNNGNTYMRIIKPKVLLNDSNSVEFRKLVDNAILLKRNSIYTNTNHLQDKVYNNFMNEYPYNGTGTVISGFVADKKNEAIIGASINVVGTNLGTITNTDGQFRLLVPSGKNKVRVSFIGYEPITLDIRTDNLQHVRLKDSYKQLEEVVVVGYGLQKKSGLTGSVATVISGKVAGISATTGTTRKPITVSTLNNATKDMLVVVDGMVFTGDISQLDKQLIESVQYLNDEQTLQLYGSEAAGGVILISSKNKALGNAAIRLNKGADFDSEFEKASSAASTIRSNFSDYAYWQPRLITDANGQATFEATFPDDITGWQSMVLAMNGKKQSGQTSSFTKSYKPLMSQLSIPAFLTSGDSCRIIGKTMNFKQDTARVSRRFVVNRHTSELPVKTCPDAIIDTFALKAITDSLTIQYSMQATGGYTDGEKRTLPVLPVGLEETQGDFYLLDKDTTLRLRFDNSQAKIKLYADADYLDVLLKESSSLSNYRYSCNEQLASRLIAMLSERAILKFQNKTINNEAQIRDIIRQLLKNRLSNGLWGWWPGSEIHYQFSAHILRALLMAHKQGFNIDIDKDAMTRNCVIMLTNEDKGNINNKLALLSALKNLDCVMDYARYLQEMDTLKRLSVEQQLLLTELKQQCGMPYNTAFIEKMSLRTLFGNLYFGEKKNTYNPLMSQYIQNTLIAYRILRRANTADSTLAKIRRYFLETKKNYGYWNTYETAQILQTILPDVMKTDKQWQKSTLSISGTINREVTEFPFEMTLSGSDTVNIRKKGFDAVYLTTYQRNWNSTPKTKAGLLELSTSLNENILIAGKETTLKVTIEAKGEASYVMIRVPIPGGCSYSSKSSSLRGNYYGEYREYFNHETIIYLQHLPQGKYNFDIKLMPRFSGSYTLNPAKAELMYFPVFNANNELKTIRIK